ncbi:hypothetical protein HCUR_00504 [Holospora curviuscula]|uniref:Uncharacterized protein n=1 Tax=Holospora curviuscula TaxID=1082868 RepID=A0A2S5R9G4_9PROT|nr:hypothetical protein HCUR_00504 [Holospora curviuscula]
MNKVTINLKSAREYVQIIAKRLQKNSIRMVYKVLKGFNLSRNTFKKWCKKDKDHGTEELMNNKKQSCPKRSKK